MDSSTNWFLALKIWALAVLKFFDVVLKFEPPNARVLNFPKNSAVVLIRLVLINGDCVYSMKFWIIIYSGHFYFWVSILEYEMSSLFFGFWFSRESPKIFVFERCTLRIDKEQQFLKAKKQNLGKSKKSVRILANLPARINRINRIKIQTANGKLMIFSLISPRKTKILSLASPK